MGMVTQTFHGRRSDDYIQLSHTNSSPDQRKNSYVTEAIESGSGSAHVYARKVIYYAWNGNDRHTTRVHTGDKRGIMYSYDLADYRMKATGGIGNWPDANGWPVEKFSGTAPNIAPENAFQGPGDLNVVYGTYVQNGSSSGSGFGANLVRITSVIGPSVDFLPNNYSTSTIDHYVQVGDEFTVMYTTGSGVDAVVTVQSIVSSTQFIVNIPNPQNTSTSGNCKFYPTKKTGAAFCYIGSPTNFADYWYNNGSYWFLDLFYKLKIAGPPSYFRNSIRFDDDADSKTLLQNSSQNTSAFMQWRVLIYESDAFFQSVDNTTDTDFTPGAHGTSNISLKSITRHDGSESMGFVKDGNLVMNTDGTLKVKMNRQGSSTNYRLLLYKNGSGSATIFENNTNNSETNLSATLTAGTYTLNWQGYISSTWQYPSSDARMKITSEPVP